MPNLFAPKQLQFILEGTSKWNLAHGSVRSGKTVGTLWRFMHAVDQCRDSQIYMIGHTAGTIYENAIRLILESPQFGDFRPFCTWSPGKGQLKYKEKTISTLGAKNEGAIGAIQGKSMSLVYCDEMTLYPESIIDMIDTRLSFPHSMGFASMNPSNPSHKIKKWIDMAESGDKKYYALHFTLDDNPYVEEDYKERIRNSLSGLFYKRNYLGLWCLADGAIFDFFDKNIHVVKYPPRAAEYWIAGIDYGTVNPFACLLIGVSTGKYAQTGKCLWVEKEFYWDPKRKERQKTNAEFADAVEEFLAPYGVKQIYMDPSAEAFHLELRRRGLHVVHANNDVDYGIQLMTSEMAKGNLFVCEECKNTIREIESYVWDSKRAEQGFDEPLKKDDHSCVTGDTLILTSVGEIPIEQLSLMRPFGTLINYELVDGVLDKDGYINAQKTRENAEIWEVELEDGTKLRATGDHRIFTERGEIELQQLMLSDIVLTCNTKNILEESFI